MIDMLADELRLAIQQLHGCPSRLLECVPLSDGTGEQVLGRTMHIFELLGHPSAVRCYAWAAPSRTNTTVMYAVLHSDAVNSPELAVQTVLRDKRRRPNTASSA
jgi:hypothetical protein